MKRKSYIKPQIEITYAKLEPMLSCSPVSTGSIGVAGTITDVGEVYTGGIVEGKAESYTDDDLTVSKRGGFFDDDDDY